MGFFSRKEPKIAPLAKEPEQVMFYTGDDLLKRAENIVYLLGYRGAVGEYVLDVFRALQLYEKLDRETANPKLENWQPR